MELDDVLTELVAHSGDRLLRVGYQLTHDRAAAQEHRGRDRQGARTAGGRLPGRPDRRPGAAVGRARGAEREAARGAGAALLRGPGRPRDRGPPRLPRGERAQPRQPGARRHAAAGCARQHRGGGPGVSNIEDDISRVMAGHDDEAPGAADLLRALQHASGPRRRRVRRYRAGWYMPLAAAAAVAAVVVGSVWAGGLLGGRQQAPAAAHGGAGRVPRLSCPASYAGQAPWVPARPAGVDGRSRLVPQRAPSSALVCAYAGSNTAKRQAGWALSGRRSLAGGLAGLAGQLTWQPRRPAQQIFCTLVGGPQTNYLIGLTYPGGA